jgi:pentatricopeptide repeat protein
MLQHAGVAPDLYALNAYLGLHAAAGTGRTREARLSQILGWFDEFRIHKNVVTFNILAEHYVRARKPVPALGLREQMSAEGVPPNGTTFRYWATAAAQAALRAREFTDHGASVPTSPGELEAAARQAMARRASQLQWRGGGQQTTSPPPPPDGAAVARPPVPPGRHGHAAHQFGARFLGAWDDVCPRCAS